VPPFRHPEVICFRQGCHPNHKQLAFSLSFRLHCWHCIGHGEQPDCTWLDERELFCAANTLAWWPCQISKAGCWMARANENANAHGSRDLNRTFMAFKRAEASSPDWPPDKKRNPGTAAGRLAGDILPWRRPPRPPFVAWGQVNPGSTILGFRIIPSSVTRCVQSWFEDHPQHFLGYVATPLQSMLAVHEHFRFDNGDQSGFLAQCGIASQCLCVCLDATPAGNTIADGNHRAPTWQNGHPFERIQPDGRAIRPDLPLFSHRDGLPCPWRQCQL